MGMSIYGLDFLCDKAAEALMYLSRDLPHTSLSTAGGCEGYRAEWPNPFTCISVGASLSLC